MLPTFVITLREGLEAALIVGIIAAFLRQEGRRDAMRWMWLGVLLAAALCVAVGVGLRIAGEELPHKQQEALESIVAMVAVAIVTYMVVWMSHHARGLKAELHGGAAAALAQGSVMALVGMAFFAVLREGFETAVFLVAVFQDSSDSGAAGTGAILGLLVAIALGWGLYRGGVRLNLARFFKLTGAVLVIVAAGLVASSLHAAIEAGWINAGQKEAFDLGWLVDPGSVSGSLLTGVFGLQPEPSVIEVIGWVVYAVPMLVFVLLPGRLRPSARNVVAGAAAVVAPVAVVVGVLAGESTESVANSGTSAGAKTVRVAVSEAGCEPATLRVASGPTNFEVTGRGNKSVTEYEIVSGERAIAEAENIVDGQTKTFSLVLQPGRYELECPGGTTSEVGELVVTGERAAATLSPELREGIDGYRRYVERETAALVTRTQALQRALATGDVAASRRAYTAARVPYERVEPIAESFGDLDPQIDARVNDVEKGAPWTGFHPIERQLWSRDTTAGTKRLAARLVADSRRLQRRAATVELEPAQVGNGANELLNEVSKSKITGEEERYSRTDLLDFDANVHGARAAFDAIEPALRKADPAMVRTIDARFDAVTAGLAPYKRTDGRFVAYDRLSRGQIRRLSQLIDQLAEPLSRAPATALRAHSAA